MKPSYLAITLLTLALTSPWTIAAEQVDKSAQLAPGSKLDIRIQRGEVKVQGWDKAEVAIKGTLDELSQGLVFAQDGGSFVIEDKLPRSYSSHDEKGSELQIYLPTKVIVKMKGISANYALNGINGEVTTGIISGDVDSDALRGELTIKTVSGNINARNNSGNIRLETVSGDIHDEGSSGTVSYQLVSGDLTADSQATKVAADLVSGSAELQLQQVDSLSLRSVSGDLKVMLKSLDTKAQLDSVNSDIDLVFDVMPDAEFNINGGPGGKIFNALTDAKPVTTKYMRSEILKFQTGSGKADVNITTISGDINIKKH
ncbi:DUF4097 family beta strand repeat-containing protein [Shewanella dokdonensis]|uniref:DUF4097 family beta strand repeat protein n=1 Tax=Shewanella dokdonensis TaxID=712036 RepID=A0ABX8DCJ7_9GAMM|nr:DUF4097 family beta strand repeat-containing protein [Shewanella dokdonensis]MCL1074462.1 DUF4097 family beta strand repeat-containing protein [Shewanella dokdonensis]QVK22499.1 DUF4097 family beta strand repeat protein [Shewanella dokdonensis]